MKKKILLSLGFILLLQLSILIHKANATQIVEDGIYKIKTAIDTNYVLDVSGVSMEDGGNIQLWQDVDVEQQRFKITYQSDGYYTLVAMHSKKVMSVSQTNNVYQYTKNENDNQKWTIKDEGEGYYSLISKTNGLYLESNSNNASNRINIQVGEFSNSKAQKFKLENVGKTIQDGVYKISTAINTRYVLDVSGISMENGGNIQLWEDANVDQQSFKVTYQGDGYYTLTAMHSQKLMSISPSLNVYQYTKNGTNEQKWTIRDVGNGYYSIISKANSLYLETEENNVKSKTNIRVGEKSYKNNQKFKLQRIDDEIPPEEPEYQIIEDGIYKIKSKINTNYVLDVSGVSMENKGNIQLWEDSNVEQQRFKVEYQGNGYYTLTAMHSKKLMSLSSTENIYQYTQDGSDEQKWVIKDVGNGCYNLISKKNGLYLETDSNSVKNRTNIQVGKSNNSNTQIFEFENVGRTIKDGVYKIKTALDLNYVLDVSGVSMKNGGNIQLWEDVNVDQQRFKVTYQSDGYYTIMALHSKKMMDVENGGSLPGTNIWQYENNGTNAQKWIIKDVGNGYYNLISKSNSLFLEAGQKNISYGTNIQVGTKNNSNSQKFRFEDAYKEEEKEIGKQTVKDGIYEIKSGINTHYALDVSGISMENKGNIQLWEDSDVDQQRFKVIYQGNGYYKIVAFHSNKAMSAESTKKMQDMNVYQYELNNSNTENWIIKDIGNGYYSLISYANGLYVESSSDTITNRTNIQLGIYNSSNNQKFKFEYIGELPAQEVGTKTLEDGIYKIKSKINNKYVLDVSGISMEDGGNIQLWEDANVKQQRFLVKYQGDGYYTLTAVHSLKLMSVASAAKVNEINVYQYTSNGSEKQKWIIKDIGNGYYSLISNANNLYLETSSTKIENMTNIQVGAKNNLDNQQFQFEHVTNKISINTSKYPGYQEKINALAENHPNWTFELLYTGLRFNDVVAGETAVHSRNLVPTSYGGEWVCSTCGTRLYDSGWYCASSKAVAYYMDPRNFLDETNIFQFVDVNQYTSAFNTSAVQNQINDTYLQNYANDILTACRNQGVNPFYIISRLIQEQGRKGTSIGTGMNGGDGKTYYNPFDIGATGNGWSEIYANALARAKSEGWDTMEKAIEGGITFCKKNWLDNYQNTLYQNKFDIDTRNGSALYNHQYMQNLMGAYSEARLLKGMYSNSNMIDSEITFIIPIYEEMDISNYPEPKNNTESYPMDVETTGTYVRIREGASTDSAILRTLDAKGTRLLSIQRGINSNWQKVITTDGLVGYISGDFVKQIDDIITCNYTAIVKTNDGDGCNVRIGPSTRVEKITALADYTQVTVIDNSTYKYIDGYDWYRIIMPNGIQAFIPSNFLR